MNSSEWKYERYPGQIDAALSLLGSRDGWVFEYELRNSLSVLEQNGVARLDTNGSQAPKIVLTNKGWAEIYRRREAVM